MFAKKTLQAKPVLPLVVGEGWAWTTSVVGLLCAGEYFSAAGLQSEEPKQSKAKQRQRLRAAADRVFAFHKKPLSLLSTSRPLGHKVRFHVGFGRAACSVL